jgi:hypothetical protein
MFDEVERLLQSAELFELLTHYGDLGKEDREIWHDRLTEFQGARGRDLTRLYGELLAHGWLEQNTGDTPILELGRFASCYRIGSAGLKALKEVRHRQAEMAVV